MAGPYLASYGIDINSVMSRIQAGGAVIQQSLEKVAASASGHLWRLSETPTINIVGARIPRKPTSSLWNISIRDGKISSVEAHDPTAPSIVHLPGVLDASGRLVAPSLCHAHVHLDKCFLLQDPHYADLELVRGDFAEAMSLTGAAKQRFTPDDLQRRGGRLIEESMESGVTAMRAFVEVDEIVELKCLEAGLTLKAEFEEWCHVQICAFAQLPLFSGEDGGSARRAYMEEAISRQRVDVIGSTPYVEDNDERSKQNVTWVIEKALTSGKHVDFHLDYNLDPNTPALVWFVLAELKRLEWPAGSSAKCTVCLGHCTRLTLFNASEWRRLQEAIGELPVSFIGLPTSDLFMMGRPEDGAQGHQRPRGTLQIPAMVQQLGINAAMSINNVGNAFTPQGNCDTLSVASLGVAIYQAGAKSDTDTLYECVSSRAKAAIGCPASSLDLKEGEPADFVMFGSQEDHWRRRKSIAEVVFDPSMSRSTMLHGREMRLVQQ